MILTLELKTLKLSFRRNHYLITILSLAVFLIITYGVIFKQSWISSFDSTASQLVRGFANPTLTRLTIQFTQMANIGPAIGFIVGACLILLLIDNGRSALFLFVNGIVLAGPVNSLIKLLIDRQRPTLAHLVQVHSSSFPNGHSMSAMMVGGSLIIIINHIMAKKSQRLIINCLIGLFIILIGLSRIYVGVHFASDVLGGWTLGFFLLRISQIIFEKIGVL